MDWSNILVTILSVLIGGLITAYFSRRYYVKASEDLKQETDSLKQLTRMLMLMMHDAGLIEVEWAKDGNPIRVVRLGGEIRGQGSFSGRLEVGPSDDTKKDEVR